MKYEFESFNPKDPFRGTPYEREWLKFDKSANLKCEGQGKDYCRVRVSSRFDFKLDKNKTHVFYCQKGRQKDCDREKGGWEVKKNLDIDPDDVDCRKYNKNY